MKSFNEFAEFQCFAEMSDGESSIFQATLKVPADGLVAQAFLTTLTQGLEGLSYRLQQVGDSRAVFSFASAADRDRLVSVRRGGEFDHDVRVCHARLVSPSPSL